MILEGDITANSVLLTSDRNAKENFKDLNSQEVLTKVVQLPVSEWNFKKQMDSVRHVGPVAQDFHSAFGLGADNKHISPMDGVGVALASIQGLHQMVQEKDAEIQELKARLARLEARLAEQSED